MTSGKEVFSNEKSVEKDEIPAGVSRLIKERDQKRGTQLMLLPIAAKAAPVCVACVVT